MGTITEESIYAIRKRWIGVSAWPCFSPDGQSLVFTGNADRHDCVLMVVAVNGDTSPRILTAPEAGAKRPHWHPGSKKIAFNRGNTTVWELDLEAGTVTPFQPGWKPQDGRILHPCYAPDGNSIYAVWDIEKPQGREAVVCRLHHGNALEPVTSFPEVCAGRLHVHPNGETIAFAGNAGFFKQGTNQVWLVSPPGKPQRLEVGEPYLCQGRCPAWSGDGKWIACVSTRPAPNPQDEMPKAVWIIDAEGKNAYPITRNTLNAMHIAWSPDQTQLAISFDTYLGLLELPEQFRAKD